MLQFKIADWFLFAKNSLYILFFKWDRIFKIMCYLIGFENKNLDKFNDKHKFFFCKPYQIAPNSKAPALIKNIYNIFFYNLKNFNLTVILLCWNQNTQFWPPFWIKALHKHVKRVIIFVFLLLTFKMITQLHNRFVNFINLNLSLTIPIFGWGRNPKRHQKVHKITSRARVL